MPSLGEFARRIRRRARQIEEGVDEVVIKTAGAVNQAVVLATPVDTGRARANWQVGLGAPERAVREEEDPSGSGTIGRNNLVISGRAPRQTIYLSNNVDYIGRLNEGSSSQAPAGFVEEAVAAGVRAVRSARVIR